MLRNPQEEDSDSVVSHDDTASVLALSQSAPSVATTVSEIRPHDSVSNRLAVLGDDATSVAPNQRGAKAATNSASVVSLNTGDEQHLYHVIGGRVFTSQSDLYALPADDEEHTRLDMQHFAMCLSINSLYFFKNLVKHTLRKDQEPPPGIIDFGTGSGRWAVDMAIEFPWANVVGTDLVPPALLSSGNMPANCRFEIDDFNLSMHHFANQFMLAHARFITGGLNDTESFIFEVARVLRPGGVFLLGTADMQFYNEAKEPIPWVQPGEPGFSWTMYVTGMAYLAWIRRGSFGLNGRLWWKEWMESNPNYSRVYEEDAYIPLGPWKEGLDERETFASNLAREDVARLIVAWRRALVSAGHKEEDIDRWSEECSKELRSLSTRMYWRFTFFAAVRSDEPWQERDMRIAPEDLKQRSVIKGIDLKNILLP